MYLFLVIEVLYLFQIGDQILEVNGQSFIVISHDEAVHILKTGRNLLMNVRDVGRLPHARKVVDEAKWISGQSIAETNATTNPSSVANHNVNVVVSTSAGAGTCTSRWVPVIAAKLQFNNMFTATNGDDNN